MRASTKLRKLMSADEVIVAPGCYDGLSARLIEAAGFKVAYATGGGIARSTGIPDMGLMTLSDNATRLREIVDAVDIPIIADMDTGYGNALNAIRAVREFERANVAGFHLEDQTFPKRCGHLEDKGLVPAAEFCQKLRAVRDAATDDDLVIIARTDAIAVEGFDAAIERMEAYMDAGADVAFVEAPTTMEQIEQIARRLGSYPLLINMFHSGKTPLVAAPKLKELGYKFVIIPSDTQRAAIGAMQRVLAAIAKDGHSGSMVDEMASFKDREAIVNTEHYMDLNRRYGS